jgi:hypothetical protein
MKTLHKFNVYINLYYYAVDECYTNIANPYERIPLTTDMTKVYHTHFHSFSLKSLKNCLNNYFHKAGGMDQVVEHLFSKYKALRPQ